MVPEETGIDFTISVDDDHRIREMNCTHKKSVRPIAGIPLVFVLTESCVNENAKKFRAILNQAIRYVGVENIYVVDVFGCEVSLSARVTVLDLTKANGQDLFCLFRNPSIRVEAFKSFKRNLLFTRWFCLAYFMDLYQARTIVYLSNDTFLLAHPLHFLPTSNQCGLTSISAISDHIALLQKPIMVCVLEGFLRGQSIPALQQPKDRAYVEVFTQDLLAPCQQLSAANGSCTVDLSRSYRRMLLREHQISASQGMVMWGRNGSDLKRFTIEAGMVLAEDSRTREPVQLTAVHLQGRGKRFFNFFKNALQWSRADPLRPFLFDPAHAARNESLAWKPKQTPARGARPSPRPRGPHPAVPLVFSPLKPCFAERREMQLVCVRQAARAAGAGSVYVLDVGRCFEGRAPDGVTVVSVEQLLKENPECQRDFDTFDRSYVHLSKNDAAMEKMSMARWIYLRCFARHHGLAAVMHSDGDVLHLADPLHYPPDIAADGPDPTLPPPPARWGRPVSVISGISPHNAVLQRPVVECVAQAAIDAFAVPERLAEWRAYYHQVWLAFRRQALARGGSTRVGVHPLLRRVDFCAPGLAVVGGRGPTCAGRARIGSGPSWAVSGASVCPGRPGGRGRGRCLSSPRSPAGWRT